MSLVREVFSPEGSWVLESLSLLSHGDDTHLQVCVCDLEWTQHGLIGQGPPRARWALPGFGPMWVCPVDPVAVESQEPLPK
jgi:hypothetical protein